MGGGAWLMPHGFDSLTDIDQEVGGGGVGDGDFSAFLSL